MSEIAVLGANGFIGSNLARDFSAISITRKNYDDYIGRHFNLFINAAGNSNKIAVQKDPVLGLEANTLDTLNSTIDFTFDHYIYLSTCEVYSNLEENTTEDTILNPMYMSSYALSKYFGECVVQRYCKKWLILRLNGVINNNVTKGVVYDIVNGDKLWISKESEFQFIHTDFISEFIKKITKWGQIYNLTGKGVVKISDLMFRDIPSPTKPNILHKIDISKANRIMKIPESEKSIERLMNFKS